MAQEPGAIPLLPKSVLDDVRSGNDTQKELAAGALAEFLEASPFDRSFSAARGRVLVEAGAVAPLVDIARSGSADAKTQASRALMTLALDHGLQVVRAGYIEPLVELMRNGPRSTSCSRTRGFRWGWEDASSNAGQTLLNLLPWKSSTQIQDAIWEAGGIPPLVELAREKAEWEFLNAAVVALDHLACGNASNQVRIAIAEGGIVALVKLARTGIFWAPGVAASVENARKIKRDNGQSRFWRADAKARAIAARMLALRRLVIVHKCVDAVLPHEIGNHIAGFSLYSY